MSALPLLSKVFQRLVYDQACKYLEKYLNNLFCGFRKAHSTQHALFKLLQTLQEELNKFVFAGTILKGNKTTKQLFFRTCIMDSHFPLERLDKA